MPDSGIGYQFHVMVKGLNMEYIFSPAYAYPHLPGTWKQRENMPMLPYLS
jgi:hypothetical protein